MSDVTIGPLERFGVGFVGTDVAHDLAFEIVSRREDAASDQVTLDLRKPNSDLVEPGRVGRCVVERDAWMLGQKRDDSLGLMSRKVVHDDVNFLVGRLGGHHVGQKGDKLRAGVTGGGLGNHLTGAHIQGGVERESAVTVVFEAVALGTAERERQDRIEPVQGLNGALFIDRENRRVNWWVEVETDDIGRLGLEVRIRCWSYIAGGDGVEDRPYARPARRASESFPTLWPDCGCSTGWLPRWLCGAE